MGNDRVTERTAVSLSVVTARGVATTSVSASLFRKDNTALTPSAFKKAVAGFRPLAGLARSLGLPRMPRRVAGVAGVTVATPPTTVVEVGTAGVPATELLPKL